MGVVVRGFDPALRRPVAIKMILETGRAGTSARERFAREARAAARLRHPGIVGIHEVGEHEGKPFIVMDFVEGRTLDEVLEGGAWPARRVVELVAKVARALDHAHAQGIVHRDVKPANVLIDGEGEPRLSDFGLALDLDASDRITLSGQLVGTPAYVSPEQASGDRGAIGPTTDVYALGAVLYHALVGRPPFAGDTILEVLRRVHEEDPRPLRQIQPSVHPDLETITLKCMEKAPARRYESAAAVAAELDRFLAGEAIRARPLGRRERMMRWARRRPALSAAIAVSLLAVSGAAVAGLVGAVWSYQTIRAERDRFEQERARAVEAERRSADAARLESSLRARAEAESQAKDELLGRALAERAARLAAEERWDEAAVLAAHSLTFVENGTARGTVAEGIAQLRRIEWIGPWRDALAVAWSPDGRLLATGRSRGGVDLWDARSGRAVATFRGHHSRVRGLAWSPDGTRVATGSDDASLRIWDVPARRELAVVHGHEGGVSAVAWSGDGTRIVTGCADGGVRVWDARRATPVLQRVAVSHGGRVGALALDPTGRRVASGGADGVVRIASVDADGQEGSIVHEELARAVTAIAWSGDGKRLAIGFDGEADAPAELVVIEPETGLRVGGIDGLRGAIGALAWSGDGALAAGDAAGAVFVADFAGDAGRAAVLVRHDAAVSDLRWGPGGEELASTAADGDLRVVDRASGEPRLVSIGHGVPDPDRRGTWGASRGASCVAWRPDDARLVTGGSDLTLRIWDAESGEQLLVLRGHEAWIDEVDWSPDGGRIASSADDGTVRVWDAETGEELLVLAHETENVARRPVYEVAWSPDGSRIASAGRDSFLKIWDAETGEKLAEHGSLGMVDALDWSPDGTRIATAGHDRKLRVRVLETGEVKEVELGKKRTSWDLDWSPRGHVIAVGGNDGKIILYDAESLEAKGELDGHSSGIGSVAFDSTGGFLASSAQDRTVRIWNVIRREVADIYRPRISPNDVRFAASGRLAIADASGRVIVRAAGPSEEGRQQLMTMAGVSGLCFAPDGRRFVIGCFDGSVRIAPTPESGAEEPYEASWSGGGLARRTEWSPDGERIASTNHASVKLWTPGGEELAARPVGGKKELKEIAWRPDGGRLAVVPNRREVLFLDASGEEPTLKTVGKLEGLKFAPAAIAWSPDGRRLLATMSYEGAFVFDAETGEQLHRDEGVGHSWAAAWSRDGSRIAVGASERDIVILDGERYHRLATLRGHLDEIHSLAFSPDGRWLASAGHETSIRIWSMERYEEAIVLSGLHEHPVNGVSWSPDGTRLLSGASGLLGVALWDVGQLLAADPADLVERFAAQTGLRVQGLDVVGVDNRLRVAAPGGR